MKRWPTQVQAKASTRIGRLKTGSGTASEVSERRDQIPGLDSIDAPDDDSE
jgi:hypothetical protein